jgi:hypothetical protein
MTLNLHSGGELVEYAALRELETPPATPSHVPIEHYRLVDLVRSTLGMFGHEIVDEHHAIDHDGQRYFGLMELRSTWTGYTDTCGLRNSNDKTFPIGISFGSKVFVCSNLCFSGDHVIRRKHTANAKRELPGLLMEIIEPLALHREAQHRKIEHYRSTPFSEAQADHAILQLYRRGAVNIQRVPEIIREWEEPSFEEFSEPTAWRLFNACTHALTGRVMERPDATPRLHQVLDELCEHVG